MGLAWIENPRVDGSIPSQATTHKNPHQCKLVGVLFLGSADVEARPLWRGAPGEKTRHGFDNALVGVDEDRYGRSLG